MPTQTTPSLAQLQRAIRVSEKIEELQAELRSILGSPETGKRKYTKKAVSDDTEEAAPKRKYTKKAASTTKRTMSPEAREKIAAAQRKRWAKQAKTAKSDAE